MAAVLVGNWTGDNRLALEEWIGRDFGRIPVAVFDWDGSCIHGDVADEVFHTLSRSLRFHFELPQVWDWIAETGYGARIRETYTAYIGRLHPNAALQLYSLLEFARREMHEEQDSIAGWAWDSGSFIGWRPAQVREYAQAVIQRSLASPLDLETLPLPLETSRPPLVFSRGLRERSEMRQLTLTMQRAGWEVWIVSAAPQWVVEPFAARYGISPARVVGMSRRLDLAGRITPEVEPPVTFDCGKISAFRERVTRARPPDFVAADSEGDWPLLEFCGGLRLLINPATERLRDYALWRARQDEAWLVQDFAPTDTI